MEKSIQDNKYRIIKVPQPDHLSALKCLEQGSSPGGFAAAHRFLAHARRSKMDLNHFYAFQNESGQYRHAALIIPQQGGTGMLFLSKPVDNESVKNIQTLLETLCSNISNTGINLAQALVSPHDTLAAEALTLAGFSRLTTLDYMTVTIDRKYPAPQFPSDVTLYPYTDDLREDFLQALDLSYVQTCDCPGLHGLRSTEDILNGHMAVGEFDPELWHVIYVGDELAGVMLLNVVPNAVCVELVYLGIAPQFRKRKLGHDLLLLAKHLTKQRGLMQLSLAVDATNVPAKRLYSSAKLIVTTSRDAYLLSLNPGN